MNNPQSPDPAETYEQYLGPTIADPWTRVLLEYASPCCGERVLDVACGTGSVARQVAPIVGIEGKVVALDVNPDMLRVARRLAAPRGAAIEWLQGDAAHLDLPDDAFDLVLCQQGLQFFSGRDASLREMRRVLATGGRVVLSVWRSLPEHPLYETLLEATARRLDVPVSAVDLSFSLWDAQELRGLLGAAGFRQIEVTPCSLTVRLPSPERFVQLTVAGAATSVPAFAQLDAAARRALVESVGGEVQAAIQRFHEDDMLVFPMHAHIAIGYAH
jgi:SAM-dependent methyltransferase